MGQVKYLRVINFLQFKITIQTINKKSRCGMIALRMYSNAITVSITSAGTSSFQVSERELPALKIVISKSDITFFNSKCGVVAVYSNSEKNVDAFRFILIFHTSIDTIIGVVFLPRIWCRSYPMSKKLIKDGANRKNIKNTRYQLVFEHENKKM